MRVYDVLGVAGSGLIFAVGVVCGACGGGAPDSTDDAQGAATGAKAGVPTGSASGTAAASAAPAGSSAPKSSTATDAGDGRDAASPNPQAGDDDDNGFPGLPGLPGLPGKIGNGNDCCFNGKYFRCPDPTACFGGFDVNACIGKCGADVQCIEDCTSQLDDTAAPKGCDANAVPPPGVDCELGFFQE